MYPYTLTFALIIMRLGRRTERRRPSPRKNLSHLCKKTSGAKLVGEGIVLFFFWGGGVAINPTCINIG